MKKSIFSSVIVMVLAILVFAFNNGYFNDVIDGNDQISDNDALVTNDSIRIAAFNIQIFGESKRGKSDVMETLVDIVREFDVVLVQEIRDSSETTAPIFLEAINALDGAEYAFVRSERLGRSSSKEAYAYFYNTETVQYLVGSAFVYDDVDDVFEREPFVASFRAGCFDFTLIGIHTKPDDAYNEIGNLTIVFDLVESLGDERDIIALGDFNADGSYFDEDSMSNPLRGSEYIWVIGNDVDTMTKTDWTYDRMVMTDYTYSGEYIADSAMVYRFDSVYGLNQTFTEAVSDYYPIYGEFNTGLPDDD
ncbi:MAG: endonuclease/exonuclease/phosphatase family protein [Candidatus Bathyarchaeota archaeon]